MGTVAASQALQKGAVLKTKNYEYVIEKVLGSGTYGITYLATARVALADGKITQMRFAIKEHFMNTCYRDTDGRTVHVTEKGRAEVERTRTDFLGESERLQSLCMLSRNIVNVIESFRANGTAYYVMEYLDGGNPQPTTESEAVHIVRQVAEALGKIHQSYMLHLDIKPANIVFKSTKSGDRYPVLIDFGVAKRFDHFGNPKTGLQAKGASRGYAPQEQFSDIKSFSPKYDIYALGGVLLYLLSGKNPPDAAKVSPAQTEIKEMIPDWVSPATRNTILEAMAPSQHERTPDVEAFLKNLGPKPATEESEPVKPEIAPVKPEPVGKPEPKPAVPKAENNKPDDSKPVNPTVVEPKAVKPEPAAPVKSDDTPAADPDVLIAEVVSPANHIVRSKHNTPPTPPPNQPVKPKYSAMSSGYNHNLRKNNRKSHRWLSTIISAAVALIIGFAVFFFINPGFFEKKVDPNVYNMYQSYCQNCEEAANDDDIINRPLELQQIREFDYVQVLNYEAQQKPDFPDLFNRSSGFIDRLEAKFIEAAEKYNDQNFLPISYY